MIIATGGSTGQREFPPYVMKYQRVPMPPANLEQTVARYNSFVDSGMDDDSGGRVARVVEI